MRCAKCGTENADELRICNQCATRLNRPCPKCGYENTPEAKFCGQCAAPLQAPNVAPQSSLGSNAATLETRPRRVGVAVVLSLLIPGWGQIYNGQFRKALWIRGGWVIAGLCAAAVGLPATFFGLLALLLANVVFYMLIAVEAVVCAQRFSLEPRRFTPNRWYAYLGFVAIVSVLSLSSTLVSQRFFFQVYKIPSSAMEPTLLTGDHIMVDKRARIPHRGDVIVFVFPPDPTKDFLKRVIGIPGDTVQIKAGRLYLDGQEVPDSHAHFEIAPQDRLKSSERDYFGPLKIPPAKYFVMGDNRDRSYDSRYWGLVDEDQVKGRVLYIYWSWDAGTSAATQSRWQRIGMHVE
jgi:signal peptidase I